MILFEDQIHTFNVFINLLISDKLRNLIIRGRNPHIEMTFNHLIFPPKTKTQIHKTLTFLF